MCFLISYLNHFTKGVNSFGLLSLRLVSVSFLYGGSMTEDFKLCISWDHALRLIDWFNILGKIQLVFQYADLCLNSRVSIHVPRLWRWGVLVIGYSFCLKSGKDVGQLLCQWCIPSNSPKIGSVIGDVLNIHLHLPAIAANQMILSFPPVVWLGLLDANIQIGLGCTVKGLVTWTWHPCPFSSLLTFQDIQGF